MASGRGILCVLTLESERTDVDVWRCSICNQPLETPKGIVPANRVCDPSKVRACDCQAAGYCKRHRMAKTDTLYAICRNDNSQRQVWDFIAATGRSPHGEQPSAARRVVNFGVAAVRHFFSGNGTRSDQEIEQILEVCQTCPTNRFNGKYCESIECGCYLSKKTYFSKIAWDSEHCPDGHW